MGIHPSLRIYTQLTGDRGVSWIVVDVDMSHGHLKEGTSMEKNPPSEWPRSMSALYILVSD